MDVWRLEKFQTLVGQTVELSDLEASSKCDVTITEVVESNSLGEGWESFSVVMNTEADIEQGTFVLSHTELGSTTLFITANSASELESIFNLDLSKI